MPVHPRDRLAKATKDDVAFLKQVPVHPRDRLRRKTKQRPETPEGLAKRKGITNS